MAKRLAGPPQESCDETATVRHKSGCLSQSAKRGLLEIPKGSEARNRERISLTARWRALPIKSFNPILALFSRRGDNFHSARPQVRRREHASRLTFTWSVSPNVGATCSTLPLWHGSTELGEACDPLAQRGGQRLTLLGAAAAQIPRKSGETPGGITRVLAAPSSLLVTVCELAERVNGIRIDQFAGSLFNKRLNCRNKPSNGINLQTHFR